MAAVVAIAAVAAGAGACSSGGAGVDEGSGGAVGEEIPKIVLSRETPNLAPDLADVQVVAGAQLDAEAPGQTGHEGETGAPGNTDDAGQPAAPTAAASEFASLSFKLFDGGTRTLGHYLGTPLVVNFFASWCPPCVREMPEFQAVFEMFELLGADADTGAGTGTGAGAGARAEVAFLGLSQDSTTDAALDLVEATGVTYDIGWDYDLDVYKAVGALALPTTAFFTAEGELADVFAGPLNQEGLLDRIAAIAETPGASLPAGPSAAGPSAAGPAAAAAGPAAAGPSAAGG